MNCLPSYTTHALQPCDVGVFGLLNSAWKAEVVKYLQQYLIITKHNLLEYYNNAWKQALKPTTIISAFVKTRIWPLNCHALNPQLFEPFKNTTIQFSQLLPTTQPLLLIYSRCSTISKWTYIGWSCTKSYSCPALQKPSSWFSTSYSIMKRLVHQKC